MEDYTPQDWTNAYIDRVDALVKMAEDNGLQLSYVSTVGDAGFYRFRYVDNGPKAILKVAIDDVIAGTGKPFSLKVYNSDKTLYGTPKEIDDMWEVHFYITTGLKEAK